MTEFDSGKGRGENLLARSNQTRDMGHYSKKRKAEAAEAIATGGVL